MEIPEQKQRLTILWVCGGWYYTYFRNLGHRVITVVDDIKFKGVDDDIVFDYYDAPDECYGFIQGLVDTYSPDVIIQGDYHSPILHLGLEKIPIPKILYSWSGEMNPWKKHYAAIFDFIYYAYQNDELEMTAYTSSSAWLPLSHRPGFQAIEYNNRTKNICVPQDISLERTPKAYSILTEVIQEGVVVDLCGNKLQAFSEYKICLNFSENGETSQSFFDIPAYGSLMVSTPVIDAGLFLEPGKDFLVFNTQEELVNLLKWIPEHQGEVQEIISRGQRKILNHHTLIHRCESMVEKARELMTIDNSHSMVDRAHLAYAYQQCAQYGFPDQIKDFFTEQSLDIIEDIKYDPIARPWCLLSNAILAFENEDYMRGYRIINNILEGPDDLEFQLQYYNYSIMLAVQCEYSIKAAAKLREALDRYPNYEQFQILAKKIDLECLEKKILDAENLDDD